MSESSSTVQRFATSKIPLLCNAPEPFCFVTEYKPSRATVGQSIESSQCHKQQEQQGAITQERIHLCFLDLSSGYS